MIVASCAAVKNNSCAALEALQRQDLHRLGRTCLEILHGLPARGSVAEQKKEVKEKRTISSPDHDADILFPQIYNSVNRTDVATMLGLVQKAAVKTGEELFRRIQELSWKIQATSLDTLQYH